MKSVLVLGATSDIAVALSKLLAAAGIDLILASRNPDDLNAQSADLEIRYGVNVRVLPFEARNFSSHPDLVKTLDPLPDAAVAVFGYLGDQVTADTDFEEARTIVETNLLGAISVLNLVALEFESRKTGMIVGISSVAGERGRKKNYIYGSAKAGFTAYLSGLRGRLFEKGVHVLTVKPGFIKTRMTTGLSAPGFLTGHPEKVASDILSGMNKKKDVVYTPGKWRWVMILVRLIPERLFKKLSF